MRLPCQLVFRYTVQNASCCRRLLTKLTQHLLPQSPSISTYFNSSSGQLLYSESDWRSAFGCSRKNFHKMSFVTVPVALSRTGLKGIIPGLFIGSWFQSSPPPKSL